MSIDEDNTARKLMDQELWVTSKLCRWGIHKWLKFREPTERKVSYFRTDVVQERRCGHCNKQDFIRLRSITL